MHTHVAAMAFMQEGRDPTRGKGGVTATIEHIRRYDIRTALQLRPWIGFEVPKKDLISVLLFARDDLLKKLAAETLLLAALSPNHGVADDDLVGPGDLETVIRHCPMPRSFRLRDVPFSVRRAVRYFRELMALPADELDLIRDFAWNLLVVSVDAPKSTFERLAKYAPEPWKTAAANLLEERYP